MEKPTIEQIAWVCKCFIINSAQKGTYRNLLYDTMELDMSSYTALQLAGALEINNALCDYDVEFAYHYIVKVGPLLEKKS